MARKEKVKKNSISDNLYPVSWIPRKDSEIIDCYLKLAPTCTSNRECLQYVSGRLDCPYDHVQKVVKKAGLKENAIALRNEIKETLFKDKIPALRRVQELSLSVMIDRLTDFATDKGLREKLGPQDLKTLADTVTKFEDILRLDMGQATTQTSIMVVHNQHQTINLIRQLASGKDPVFEYPAIDVDTKTKSDA